MEIKFQITEEDFIQFNLYHMENSPTQKRLFYFSRYLLPLLFSGIIYIVGTTIFKQPSLFWVVIALVFFVFWIIYYPKHYKKFIRKHVQKLLNEGDNSSIFAEKTLLIGNDRLTISDQFSSNTIFKENIKDVKAYDDLF